MQVQPYRPRGARVTPRMRRGQEAVCCFSIVLYMCRRPDDRASPPYQVLRRRRHHGSAGPRPQGGIPRPMFNPFPSIHPRLHTTQLCTFPPPLPPPGPSLPYPAPQTLSSLSCPSSTRGQAHAHAAQDVGLRSRPIFARVFLFPSLPTSLRARYHAEQLHKWRGPPVVSLPT